jgi:hypothetical protein
MRRIGEILLTLTVLIMVASLTLADQLGGKRGKPSRQRPEGSALTEGGARRDESRRSRADSIVMHVL